MHLFSPLKRVLSNYFSYYHVWRPYLSLNMDCPQTRPVALAAVGEVIAIPEVGGLHHHFEQQTA
jgi:hypothetical protein